VIKSFTQFINEELKPIQLSGELLKQYNWLVGYMKSPKYLERLKKEFPKSTDQEIKSERDQRFKNVSDLKNKVYIEGKDKLGGSAGFYIPKTSYGEQLVWGKWEKPDPNNPNKGSVFLRTEYKPSKFKPDEGFEFIPTHEFSHAVDDGGYRIPKSTQDKIYQLTKPGKYSKQDVIGHWREKEGSKEFDYEQTPSELIGRIQAVRALLDRLKLYDVNKDFTTLDWDKIITNPKVKQDAAFQDIIKSIKGDDGKGVNCPEKKKNFIELLNTVAQIDNSDIEKIIKTTA